MKYQNIIKAKFISRPNRFIAKVEIDGKTETAHVKNTGRCRELLVPGCTVYLEDFDGRMGSRKLRYSLIAVEKIAATEKLIATEKTTAVKELATESFRGNDFSGRLLLINMDSQAPNRVVEEALKAGAIAFEELGPLTLIRPETTYGDSRFDFYVEGDRGKGFIEVKGCTLEQDGACSFPDAPTERGVKHINELVKAKNDGYFAAIVFAVQMGGMKYLTPNDATHPAFGDALRSAAAGGVLVRAFECRVSPDTLEIDHEIPVRL